MIETRKISREDFEAMKTSAFQITTRRLRLSRSFRHSLASKGSHSESDGSIPRTTLIEVVRTTEMPSNCRYQKSRASRFFLADRRNGWKWTLERKNSEAVFADITVSILKMLHSVE